MTSRTLAPLGAAGLTAAAVLLTGCGGTDTTAPASAAGGHGGHGGASASAAPATTAPATPSDSPSAVAAKHNDADVMFAQMMMPHHQQAMDMADLAPTRATSPQVKQLAGKIKAAQGPEIAQLHSWLEEWAEPYPMDSDHAAHGGMSGMMTEADMDALTAARGRQFDRMFLQMMLRHHQGAVEMAKTQQAQGEHPQAKALAGTMVADQTAEITQMRTLLNGA